MLEIETFTQCNLAVIHTSSLATALNTAVLHSGILLLSRFYFPLIFHFFDGSLDSFLITQKLVRAQRVQILIEFKKYGHTSGEGNIDDVLIGDACRRKTKQSYTYSFIACCLISEVIQSSNSQGHIPASINTTSHSRVSSQLGHSLVSALGTAEGENSHRGEDSFFTFAAYTCEINRKGLPWRPHHSFNTGHRVQ